MKKIYSIVLLFWLIPVSIQAQNTEVVILPSIHALHKSNLNYSYDDLFKVIRAFKPEVIGVEIRQEDIAQSREYLDPFYPDEMIMVRDSFPSITSGIDFYGSEVEGELMDKEIFKDTLTELGKYVQLQRKMQQDSLIKKQEELLGMPEILDKQIEIAKKYSALQLMNGEYDKLTELYYKKMDSLLLQSPYQKYVEFNTLRDKKISKNALELIKSNENKRILILVGANHRNRLIKSPELSNSIKVLSPNELQSLF